MYIHLYATLLGTPTVVKTNAVQQQASKHFPIMRVKCSVFVKTVIGRC